MKMQNKSLSFQFIDALMYHIIHVYETDYVLEKHWHLLKNNAF